MTTTDQFKTVFANKLTATMDFDAAFKKAIWIAYNEGLLAGLSDTRQEKTKLIQDVSTILQRGYQS